MNQKAIPESEIKANYPKAFLYLQRFKKELLARKDAVLRRSFKTIPFYSLGAVSNYTFAPYKVVWTRIATDIGAALVSSSPLFSCSKVVIPIETATMVAFDNSDEAHYFCSLANSSPFRFSIISYSVEGTGGFGSPHILRRARIPQFDPQNKVHQNLSELSQKAHQAADGNDDGEIARIEERIDNIAIQIWGLTKEELKEIKSCLEELS